MKQSAPVGSEQQQARQFQPAADMAHAGNTPSFVDNRPETIALRQLKDTIRFSPEIIAQRNRIEQFHNYPRMIAQRTEPGYTKSPAPQMHDGTEYELLQGKLDAVQRIEEEEPLQGKFATVQRIEEEEPMQGKFDAVQRIKDEEPLQGKFATESPTQREQQPAGEPNNTGLPDNLKSGIESLSGISMDSVRVYYNSSQPAQLNALAYAQGTDIHVAPGQEQHLPHEAWHVVQQAQGRVKPTMQMKDGVPINDDTGLEHEADVMGARALAGEGTVQAASRRSAHAAQETASLSMARHVQVPVQRLIGFEVEYQVPTFGREVEAVTLKAGDKPASNNIKYFLFGGLPYGKELGGSAKPGENSFRITSDHNGAVSREPIRARLANMGKLDPADTKDRDASSNLEYVTSPVDELAKGADKVLGTLIDQVANHAATTFGLASQDNASMLTAPASGVATGMPEDNMKDWLSDPDFQLLKPAIDEFRANILDSCYLQATVGILPSAVGALFAKAGQEDGLLFTGGKFTQIYEAVNNAAVAVGAAVKEHKYIKDLQSKKETQVLASVSGMIRLLAMYLVGEALSQTAAFPGGTIKNAVPFLVKIDPSKIAESGPWGMLFADVPDDFVTLLAGELDKRTEFKVSYWRGLGYAARDRDVKDFVTTGSIENLTKMFLQGKKPPETGAQTGSQLKKLDTVTEIAKYSEYQLGIPLEYRYIKARPPASGLKPELLKLVAEARDINLGRVTEEQKRQIEKQVKE